MTVCTYAFQVLISRWMAAAGLDTRAFREDILDLRMWGGVSYHRMGTDDGRAFRDTYWWDFATNAASAEPGRVELEARVNEIAQRHAPGTVPIPVLLAEDGVVFDHSVLFEPALAARPGRVAVTDG